jgi:L-lactate permease
MMQPSLKLNFGFFCVPGTPIWFGFGDHDLTEEQFIQISYKAGTALLIASFLLLPTMVLPLCCKVQVLRENALFLTLSLSSVMLPPFGISFVSYEFPALIGGMVGCGLTAVLIQFRVGLKDYKPSDADNDPLNIETTSLNHSIISQYREDRADERSKGSGAEGIRGEIIASSSLKPLPDGLAATVPKPFANQQSSISEISVSPTVENENLFPTGDGPGSGDEEANCEDADGNVDTHALIEKYLGRRKTMAEGYVWELMGRTFPLWGTVLLLVLTRIPQIGLRDLLTRREPSFAIYFGTYGTFRMSASLVLQLQDILTYPNINWRYELLFVPFIMPFSIVAVLTMWLFKKDMQSKPQAIFGTVASRLKNPAVALMGALVLVQLMIRGGAATPAKLIGKTLSEAFGGGWIAIVAFIGALGSFFSGSTTISNLTFGGIQLIAAESIGTSSTAMLALQAAGASAGNGICLNNIISACTVVGLHVGEGQIIARTGLPVSSFRLLHLHVVPLCLIECTSNLPFFFPGFYLLYNCNACGARVIFPILNIAEVFSLSGSPACTLNGDTNFTLTDFCKSRNHPVQCQIHHVLPVLH